MPVNFFSHTWPLALTIILTGATVVPIAAVATLVVSVMRLRLAARNATSQATDEGSSEMTSDAIYPHRTSDLSREPFEVLETMTTDGIHYVPFS
jgi:hypothetical protein